MFVSSITFIWSFEEQESIQNSLKNLKLSKKKTLKSPNHNQKEIYKYVINREEKFNLITIILNEYFKSSLTLIDTQFVH